MMIFILGLASRFGFAPLLLCGAVGLALGLTQAAHGAGLWTGMTPMQSAVSSTVSVPTLTPPPGTTWDDIFDCLNRGGELNVSEPSGLTTCTPAPPAPVVVSPAPEPSRPVAAPRSNVALDHTRPTLNFIRDEPPDYRSPDLCGQLGGTVSIVSGGKVCKSVDTDDTFCVVGSKDAFPCQGLYKSVLICNQYGRPAKNPFICGEKCADDEFACGSKCVEGGIAPPDKILPVARGYSGEVFRITATAVVDPGGGQFEIAGGGVFSASVVSGSDAERAMLIRPNANLREGVEYSDVVSVEFSCAGLESHYGSAQLTFTVTTVAWQSEQYFFFAASIAGDGVHFTGAPGILSVRGGFGSLTYEKDNDNGIFVSESGALSADASWSVGNTVTITAFAVSPEFKGRVLLPIEAHFYHPFNLVLRPRNCRFPSDYEDIRSVEKCYNDELGRWTCPPLDLPMYNAAVAGDVEDLCAALRAGGSPSATNADFGVEATSFALGVAAQNNDVPIGRILLHSLSDTQTVIDLHKGNALNYAAYGGAVLFGRHLIEIGYSAAAATGDFGRHPAHALATRPSGWSQGDPRGFAELLTRHGATGNEENWREENVLHVITRREHGEHRIIEPFLRAGVSVDKPSPVIPMKGLAPLARAVNLDQLEVARALLNAPENLRPDVNLQTENEGYKLQPPLAFAASTVMIDLLIERGADVSLVATVSNFVTIHFVPVDPSDPNTEFVRRTVYEEAQHSIMDYMLLYRDKPDMARYISEQGGQCHEASEETEFDDICNNSPP